MEGMVRKVYRAKIKGVNAKEFTVDTIVSDASTDRYKEAIALSAWNSKGLSNYKKHPVLVSSHMYNNLKSQLGEAIKIKRTKEGLEMRFKYYVGEGNEEADWGFKLAEKGIAAYSIGFIPTKTIYPEEAEDYKPSKDGPRRIFTEVDLLEVSQVLVPANANALQKLVSQQENSVIKGVATDIIEKGVLDDTIQFKSLILNELMGVKEAPKSVVKYCSEVTLDKDAEWDAGKARENILKWSESEIGTDLAKFRKGFLYVDENAPECLKSYKYPHHDVVDGELKTNFNGCAAAMGRLQTATNLSEEERDHMYIHLYEEYKLFDEELPGLKDLGESKEVDFEIEEIFLDKEPEIRKEVKEEKDNKKEKEVKEVKEESSKEILVAGLVESKQLDDLNENIVSLQRSIIVLVNAVNDASFKSIINNSLVDKEQHDETKDGTEYVGDILGAIVKN